MTDKQNPQRRRVVLTGGGTGGHVYPCLAIFEILRRNQMVADTLYLGIRGRAEEKIVPRYGINLEFIRSAPIAGVSGLTRLRAFSTILMGTLQAIWQLIRFKPDLVIGTGGYASAPVIFGAFIVKLMRRKRLSIVLEEQNLVPGLLNKVSSLFADVVLLNYSSSSYFVWSHRCVHVGYPVRSEYIDKTIDRPLSKQELGLSPQTMLVLVTGGSMGSRSINRVIAQSLKPLSTFKNIYIMHSLGMAAGSEYHAVEDTRTIISSTVGDRFDANHFTAVNAEGNLFYRGVPYLHDISQWQKAADVIVSRAGAGGLAEISALGRAAIVIPKRGLPGDHQELNTIEIAEHNACIPLFEFQDKSSGIDCVDPSEFLEALSRLLEDPGKRSQLEQQSKSMFYSGFSDKVQTTIESVMQAQKLDLVIRAKPPMIVQLQSLFDNLIAHLDKLARELSTEELKTNLYYRFYSKKLLEYLEHPHYLFKNKGIKLIGALKKASCYDSLVEQFESYQGYLKRNILIGFQKADSYHPCFETAVIKGLSDSYFETRREAVALFVRFSGDLKDRPEINRRILQLLNKRWENFEVKMQCLQAAVLLLDSESFFNESRKFLYARNVRIRQSLLDAVLLGIRKGRFQDLAQVRRFLRRMLVTTSEFAPHYRIKERFNQVIESLQSQTGGSV